MSNFYGIMFTVFAYSACNYCESHHQSKKYDQNRISQSKNNLWQSTIEKLYIIPKSIQNLQSSLPNQKPN